MLRTARAAVLGLFCLFVSATAAAEASADSPPAARQVLPDTVVPSHYDFFLSPDAEKLTFRGKVAITVAVHAVTRDIVLNAVGLTFEHVSVDAGPDGVTSFDVKTGRATLHFDAPIQPGQHVLAIDYTGKIGNTTLGFFAMDYASPAGRKRTLATNFEPAHARRLLPCWDEPGRKATFTVSVDAPKDRMALSNMPVAAATPLSDTMQRVRFAESPKMSTYLLFVGIGDFERIHQAVDGVDVGVVVKRGDTVKAAYALEQAVKILHYYNGYFGIRFPLPKLDLIAAPGEIEGGSMENWGAIFYSQHHVLFDPATSTEGDRRLVFLVVAHEMAHQWFGDLVTMAWWDNLWLNEGFARWMQTFVADDLHPEWETGLVASSIFEIGKRIDAVPATHPVVQEIFTAEQAEQAFDPITYDKGAAIITMLNGYVGRDRFRDGVRRYMRAHAFGNTVDSDLWGLVQQVAGKPILAIEHDFTRQPGVPMVRTTRHDKGLHLSEDRYAQDPQTLRNEAPQKWRLPLAVRSLDAAPKTILLQDATDLSLPAPVLVNAGQLAYARVLYDDGAFAALAPQLGALAPLDQLGLLNDAFALGASGYTTPVRLMGLAATLPVAAHPVVWQRLVVLLREIDSHYADTPARVAFRKFALQLLTPVAAHVGVTGTAQESSNITVLRDSLFVAMAEFGDGAVIERARRTFASDAAPAAERRTALSIVAAHADAAAFDALLERARKTNDPLEKQHLFEALGAVSDPVLARKMIDVGLSEQVPAGLGPAIVQTLAEKHPDLVWQVVAQRLTDPALPFDQLERWEAATGIAGLSSDSQHIPDIEAYEVKNVPLEARKPFLAAEANIHWNQRFKTQVLAEIDSWIRAH